MNELLQQHGCSNVFTIPEGLKELMSDISREVLREQPRDICKFITNYLSVLLITREHGMMAVKILDDLCDCRPSVSEHLMLLGMQQGQAHLLSDIIKEEIEGFEPVGEKGILKDNMMTEINDLVKIGLQYTPLPETIKEHQIIKKILSQIPLDEETTAKVCQIARNAYRHYWYRKKTMDKSFKVEPEEPWEVAAKRTLELYKRTKPSLSELTRATEKIQAAYRGYYVRRNLLRHLKPKTKKRGPKVDIPGPPLDIAASREIDLGPLLSITVPEDDIHTLFDEHATETLGLTYDPMKTITHVPHDKDFDYPESKDRISRVSGIPSQIPKEFESRTSRAPSMVASQISEGKRQSRLPSQAESRNSRIHSQVESVDTYMQKISFSQDQPEVIPDEEPMGDEIKEMMVPETADVSEVPEIGESDVEGLEYVPEDIMIEQTDGEDSIPASVPSSAPETAASTDVEDEAEYHGTSDEEG